MNSYSPVTPQSAVLDEATALLDSIRARAHLIVEALSYADGTHELDDVIRMIMSGRIAWWPLPNSFMITEVVEYPRCKHLNVFLAGGDLEEIKAMNDNLAEAARLLGCSTIMLSGRRGWVKALRDIGWKESMTTVSRPVHYESEGDHHG